MFLILGGLIISVLIISTTNTVDVDLAFSEPSKRINIILAVIALLFMILPEIYELVDIVYRLYQ